VKLFSLNRNQNWHNWFAWRPIFVDSYSKYGFECKELVWLETIERRACFSGMDGSFICYLYAKKPK